MFKVPSLTIPVHSDNTSAKASYNPLTTTPKIFFMFYESITKLFTRKLSLHLLQRKLHLQIHKQIRLNRLLIRWKTGLRTHKRNMDELQHHLPLILQLSSFLTFPWILLAFKLPEIQCRLHHHAWHQSNIWWQWTLVRLLRPSKSPRKRCMDTSN